MATTPLENVLEALNRGNLAAAEQVFIAYEPFLRKVVRRQMPPPLRRKFDSVDVVHSVWVDLLQGFRSSGWKFASADHLRAFLVKVTRNRLIDRSRHQQPALKRECPLIGLKGEELSGRENRPSQVVQAGDLWQKMLDSCPAEHHEILRLRRQGLTLSDVADRTGLHPDSIRRILRMLARQIAFADGGVSTGS
jgi:RNA polymerase sigma-70 factor (ECF subfamily)